MEQTQTGTAAIAPAVKPEPGPRDVEGLLIQTKGWISTKLGKRCLTAKQLSKLGFNTEGLTPHARTLSSVYFKVDDFAWGAEFLELEKHSCEKARQERETAARKAQQEQQAFELENRQALEQLRLELKDKESYTSSDLRHLGWSKLAEERFLDKRLFDTVRRGQRFDYLYPGDYIRALHLRKQGSRLVVDDVPPPAAVPKTKWLMQKDVLNRGWKRSQLHELPDPIICDQGGGRIAYWYRLNVIEEIEKQRKNEK